MHEATGRMPFKEVKQLDVLIDVIILAFGNNVPVTLMNNSFIFTIRLLVFPNQHIDELLFIIVIAFAISAWTRRVSSSINKVFAVVVVVESTKLANSFQKRAIVSKMSQTPEAHTEGDILNIISMSLGWLWEKRPLNN